METTKKTELNELGKLVRQQSQGPTVYDLVYDPKTGTFIEKKHADVDDSDAVCTVMTREGFAAYAE